VQLVVLKEDAMNRLMTTIVMLSAAAVAAQTVRLGQPLSVVRQPPPVVSAAADLGQPPPGATSEDDGVLEVGLPKGSFDAGEAVPLTVRLHTRGGADLHPTVEVEDFYQIGQMDRGTQGPRRKGTQLDNRPGIHNVTVWADAVDAHGNSVHRGAIISYEVATGDLRFVDVGGVHPAGPVLVVPLKVVAPRGGTFTISGILATATTAVARAETHGDLQGGAATVELRFRLADIYESGPYHLTNVFATGTNEGGPMLAAAPQDVGRPFQAPHVQGEPPPPPPQGWDGVIPTPFSPTPIPPGFDPVPPDARQSQ
jgi:hypothetical protein